MWMLWTVDLSSSSKLALIFIGCMDAEIYRNDDILLKRLVVL